MKIAIIGGGVAAFEAAKTVRSLSNEAEITIYSREETLPYRRPALSRMASETLSDAQFYIKPESFYAENRIDLKLSHTLNAIDTANRTLQFNTGESAIYDKLLLAVGSHCFCPPIPGMDLNGVMSLREYSDLQKLRMRLDSGVRNVTVIGGGLLGLELSESLLKRNCLVTVIEGCPNLLPRNLDAEAAEIVLEMFGKVENLTLRFGRTVDSIEGKAGKVVGVNLANGTIPAELVMVSAGVRANTEIAASGQIKCNRGIVVDKFMRTSASDVYAAGDCAEVDAVSYGLYDAARNMGEIAAHNMLGEEKAFVFQPFPARLSVFGVKLFSVGKLSGEHSKTTYDPKAGTLKKLFYDANKVFVGAILIGDLREAPKLQAELAPQRA